MAMSVRGKGNNRDIWGPQIALFVGVCQRTLPTLRTPRTEPDSGYEVGPDVYVGPLSGLRTSGFELWCCEDEVGGFFSHRLQ